jgi:hypothetical protein
LTKPQSCVIIPVESEVIEMQVNDERKAKTVPFDIIMCGEPFTDEEGDFMMRTEDITGADDEVYNAVDLETGVMYTFDKDCPVIRINRASLTIHD